MNYSAIYDRLIDRGRTRLSLVDYETHHIIPRCLGGSDDSENLVKLTPEEHYLAHLLLLRIYPNNTKIAHAANMMCTGRMTNKLYGWVRRKLSWAMTVDNPNAGGNARREYNRKNGSPNKGWRQTQEQCEKIRQKQLGANNSNADGSARKTRTYLIDVITKQVQVYSCLKDAEQDLNANHASVYYNRKRNRPFRGFYWCVGENEYQQMRQQL